MRSLVVVAGSGCSIAFTFWHNIVKLDRMTELTVRHIRFPIDDTVAFQWQPANPSFGLFGNTFTFLAIAFERYLVSAIPRHCRVSPTPIWPRRPTCSCAKRLSTPGRIVPTPRR